MIDDKLCTSCLFLIYEFKEIMGKSIHHPSGYFLKIALIRICITPKNASRKILVDIFEVPRVRSVKMIGTSTSLKPCLMVVYFISIWKAYPTNLILFSWTVSKTLRL